MGITDRIGVDFQTGIELFQREFFQRFKIAFFTRSPLRQMRNEIVVSSGKVNVASQIVGKRMAHLLRGILAVGCH